MDRDQHLQPKARQLASQRAWLISDGEQRVMVSGKFVGGSMQAMMRFDCLADDRHERGKQLAPLRWRG
ncbi:MAG: hypothetical protein HEQ22_04030 [Sphingopyxis sp.]